MISISNVSVQYGGRFLFDHISFQIKPQDRIGLTGKNGAGKSTLLKIIKGIQKPDQGVVTFPAHTTVGYLAQDMHTSSDRTIYEEAQTAFEGLNQLKTALEDIQKQLETRTDYESASYIKLIEDLTEKENAFQMLDGYHADARIEQILKGLGFEQSDMHRLVSSFSGGWQMRVELAKILLQKPDVILLDEPTNHLDIESITWLESYLKDYVGAILTISHDRTFLDNITNRTIEIRFGKIDNYKAPYSTYLKLRSERQIQQQSAYENQQNEIKQMERNIERFRAKANKAKFAQSLIKKLDRMERIEVDQVETSQMRIRFPKTVSSGKVVVEANGVSKSFGQKKVIDKVSFEINRGDRIAFVGKNGMGKTTLSKIIAGQLDCQGDLKLGHNVQLGYFAQHQAHILHQDSTVFELIDNEATGDMRSQLRSLLGAFMFSGEDVDKKVKVLSGGERGRLALAKMLLKPINFLVMDEPTNHLDISSKEVLKQALLSFEGTLIVVSHDRDFLSGLTDKVFEFTSRGIKVHTGDVIAFLKEKEMQNFRQFESQKEEENLKRKNKQTDNRQNISRKEIKKIQSKCDKTEREIIQLEQEIAHMDTQLQDVELYEKIRGDTHFFATYDKKRMQLDECLALWERLSTELESMDI